MMRKTFHYINILVVSFVLFILLIITLLIDPLVRLAHFFNKVRVVNGLFYFFFNSINRLMLIWNSRVCVSFKRDDMVLEKGKPLIFISNHHSSMDIGIIYTSLYCLVKNRRVRFVCRPKLDRWLPAVSFYVRNYCHSLNFSRGFKAKKTKNDRLGLKQFCKSVNENNDILIFFPEGVKDLKKEEHCQPFSRTGIKLILKQLPEANIVPVCIRGSRRFYSTPRSLKEFFMVLPTVNTKIQISFLSCNIESKDQDKIIEQCEKVINEEFHAVEHELEKQ